MMLHRHFEETRKKNENLTKLENVTPTHKVENEFVSEVFPPESEDEQPKRGRRRKADD